MVWQVARQTARNSPFSEPVLEKAVGGEMKDTLLGALRSKTIWFNMLVAIMGAGEAVFGVLQPYIGGQVYGYGMAILLIGNTILRVLTTMPLDQK